MGQNADEYPQTQELGSNAVQVNIPADVLMGGVNRSIFATADDELRPVMNGIYFDITPEDITLVASDGHKLVRCKTLQHTAMKKLHSSLPKACKTYLRTCCRKSKVMYKSVSTTAMLHSL